MADRPSFQTPPRLTGDAQRDMIAQSSYLADLYRVLFEANTFATQDEITETVTEAVDPATATATSAQTTANSALSIAQAARTELDTFDGGSVTVSDAATTQAVTFGTAQANTSYRVMLTAVSSTGTPGVNAHVIVGVAKTTGGFTITVGAAPGVGNTVTFDWHLWR